MCSELHLDLHSVSSPVGIKPKIYFCSPILNIYVVATDYNGEGGGVRGMIYDFMENQDVWVHLHVFLPCLQWEKRFLTICLLP